MWRSELFWWRSSGIRCCWQCLGGSLPHSFVLLFPCTRNLHKHRHVSLIIGKQMFKITILTIVVNALMALKFRKVRYWYRQIIGSIWFFQCQGAFTVMFLHWNWNFSYSGLGVDRSSVFFKINQQILFYQKYKIKPLCYQFDSFPLDIVFKILFR